ncbi:hypothetical protein L6164_017163 [Bauhinia variegata]|uniref:Uncharacterized protein n=1 Tax=Bauhinia variegata TaxID=167791 RepID=A0ACB9N916_BAUVA|nr:hypothetical protein L6164_017163 [Bauhinia variegata]
MDCQKKIQLDLLNEDEAWALFKKHAEPDNQSSLSLLRSVAQDIARECKGLPIAIQAVGRSLKEQSIHAWKRAVEHLRSSKPVGVGHEDYDISNEDLIRCVVGLRVYEQYPSFDTARSQVMVGIEKLVDSCLLMHSWMWGKKTLKMHDLVCNLGIWIASKEGRAIMVNLSNNLNSLMGDGVINDQFAVSSCVLLRFARAQGDISFLVKLKKLKFLELKSCVFNELPNEIANLNKLKLLDLSECAALSGNNKAIGESSEIEELTLRHALADEDDPNSEKLINAIMHDVDRGKDGRISCEEFGTMMKARIDWKKDWSGAYII